MAHFSWRQRRLGQLLQQAREEGGYSLKDIAEKVEFSDAKLSRIEKAQSSVRDVDVALICRALSVPDALAEKLVRLARQSRQRQWWSSYADVIKSSDYLELEADSTRVSVFTTDVIPGLLQSRDYSEAVIRASMSRSTEEATTRLVEARIARQERVRNGSLELWAIFTEEVLLRPIGGHTAMAEQIDQLIQESAQRNVSVQVIPLAGGAHAGIGDPFNMFWLADGFTVVALDDNRQGARLYEEPAEVRDYEESWSRIAANALPFGHSIELLHARANDHRRQASESLESLAESS